MRLTRPGAWTTRTSSGLDAAIGSSASSASRSRSGSFASSAERSAVTGTSVSNPASGPGTWKTSPVSTPTVHQREPPAVAGEPGTMIRMVGLGRAFGELWAVRNLTLDVHAGEVLGLLGPNGAGKTTTVRMLAALIGPTEGHAQLDGHDVVTDAEAVRARVGVLTETPGLYEKLSATENLEFFGKLHGLDQRRRREAIERLLRLLGLWDRRSEPAGQFSKGMKQKLA